MKGVERGLGLHPTKIGASGKKKAYLVSSGNVRNAAILLLGVSFCCLIIGIAMKNDLSEQTKMAMRAMQRSRVNKQALYNTVQFGIRGEKDQESKLVKIMSVLEQHLARDRQEGDMFQAFQGRFSEIIKGYGTDVDAAMQELQGNPVLVDQLKTKLQKDSRRYKQNILRATKKYGNTINDEAMEAETRLVQATQALLQDLTAEVSERDRIRVEEAKLEAEDPEWESMQKNFMKAYPKSRTPDEKDVHQMLQNFEERVNTMNPPDLTTEELKKAEDLQLKLAHARPEEIEGIENQMKEMADEAGMYFVSKNAKIGEITNEFNEMVDQAKFKSAQAAVETQLNQWIDKKISDAKMMLQIQERVADGEISPSWLYANERRGKDHHYLKMSQNQAQRKRRDRKMRMPHSISRGGAGAGTLVFDKDGRPQ